MLITSVLILGAIVLPSPVTSVGKHATQMIDLTHPYDENTLHWTDSAPFRFIEKVKGIVNGLFYATEDFKVGEHTGTHMDAPYHFKEDGWKVGDIPIERFFVEGVKIDAKEEAAANPNYRLEVNKLLIWENTHGTITSPTVVIIDFGWAKKYSNKTEYFGSNTFKDDDLHFPGVSFEAAQWIAENHNIVGVGLDTPSVDAGENSVNPQSHVILTSANKYILENLALDGVTLPEKDFKLYVTPMKIKEGTGAPCRVIASVDKH